MDRMQSSRSHASLRDLPQGIENLNLNNRTASSTPAQRQRNGPSISPNTIVTPPADNAEEFGFDPVVNVVNRGNSTTRNFNNGRPSTFNVFSNIRVTNNNEDDVFREDTAATANTATDTTTARKTTGGISSTGFPTTGKPTTNSGARGVPVVREVTEYLSPDSKMTPRADRLNDPVTPQNAQGILPPDACVFVANLSATRTDEQLETSCHEAFDQFGRNVVKVRRDKHKHPFALVQYYTVDEAMQAVQHGRELTVDGRKLRTERAEVRREYIAQNGDTSLYPELGSVVLSRSTGGAISKEEARTLLERYGPIEEMHPTTNADAITYRVPEGMWVKFAYYLDSRDCLKGFNSTSFHFKVIDPPHLEPRNQTGMQAQVSPDGTNMRAERSNTDQRSIFVGNLPHDATEIELQEIFSAYGVIKSCNIIRKPITGTGLQRFNIFGFIEFADKSEADLAATAEVDIRGQRIRVEQKEYSARRHIRLQPAYGQQSFDRPPRGIPWGPSHSYQPAMPYGFQPIYIQAPPPNAMSPYGQGYWGQTPPNSGQRRRAENEYASGGSPHPVQQYLPIDPTAYRGMASYQGVDADEQQYRAPRRFR